MFESGHYLIGIFLLVLIEGAVLGIVARRTRRTLAGSDVVFHLGAGAVLLLAVWSAVTDRPWWITAGLVTVSLPLHLIDLKHRWNASAPTR
ncbi:MAG: hypothetical protein AAFX94_08580 [Myxococcota bacterium]